MLHIWEPDVRIGKHSLAFFFCAVNALYWQQRSVAAERPYNEAYGAARGDEPEAKIIRKCAVQGTGRKESLVVCVHCTCRHCQV